MRDFIKTVKTKGGWYFEARCPIDEQIKKYSKGDCGECDFYHPYTTCTYREDAKICPIDGRKCNSSVGLSSIYDCRNDYGFECRPPRCIGYEKRNNKKKQVCPGHDPFGSGGLAL